MLVGLAETSQSIVGGGLAASEMAKGDGCCARSRSLSVAARCIGTNPPTLPFSLIGRPRFIAVNGLTACYASEVTAK